jgi:hypothetical protein
MGRSRELKLRRSSSRQHSLCSLLPLISFPPFRDIVLGSQPPRRLRVYLAEAPHIHHVALRITELAGTRHAGLAPPLISTVSTKSTLYHRGKMLNYGKFYGNFTFLSPKTSVVLVANVLRKPGSSATANCYLNTMCRSPETKSLVGFPVSQAETSQLIGATPVLKSTRNPSSNWTGSSSPANISTDTVKPGGPESGLVTTPKNHSSSVRLTVVRPPSFFNWVRRHGR